MSLILPSARAHLVGATVLAMTIGVLPVNLPAAAIGDRLLLAPAPATVTFNPSGQAVQQWMVPEGVTAVAFEVWGASGAGGGGRGGRVRGTLDIASGTVLDLWIGLPGTVSNGGTPGVGGWGGRNGMRHGGAGGVGTGFDSYAPGGGNAGGGATEVDLHDGSTNATVLVMGGGGGGAGYGAGATCAALGTGGCGAQPPSPGLNNGGLGVNGQDGFTADPPGRGGGGGNAAGGAAGGGNATAGAPAASGAGGIGALDIWGGGGGGGGYGGAGGGEGGGPTSGPGGGGSGRSLGPTIGATFDTAPQIGGGRVTFTYTQVAPAGATRFVPLSPTRLLDTRLPADLTSGLPVTAGGGVDLQVSGRGGVPATNVTAVVMNVTVANALAPGFVTVWPAQQTRPEASNLNATAIGQNIANLVTVRLGSGGKVSLFSQGGSDLVVDIAGYYEPVETVSASGRYTPLAPTRILDTRESLGVPGTLAVPAGATIDLVVAGRGGVPATGVAAVVLNLTAAQALAAGFVTVWPAGSVRPTASNLNVTAAGQNIANLAIVPLGNGGAVSLFTQSGTHLVADVAGWFGNASQPTSLHGLFHPLSPARVLDTRTAVGTPTTTPVAPDAVIVLALAGRGGAPATGFGAVVLNVTAAAATAAGFVTVWPADKVRPTASNVNVTFAGQNIPNAVSVSVSAAGAVSLYTQSGTHLVADLAGYYEV